MGQIGFHTNKTEVGQLGMVTLSTPEYIKERTVIFWEQARIINRWLGLIGTHLWCAAWFIWEFIIVIGQIITGLFGIALGLSVFYAAYMFVNWVTLVH